MQDAAASSSDVNITLVDSAVQSGAVCLDGSSPAYQFDKGRGKRVKNWLVHLQHVKKLHFRGATVFDRCSYGPSFSTRDGQCI
ncbi:hypothetical protein LguiA_017040 [Lonicera macranthoides]